MFVYRQYQPICSCSTLRSSRVQLVKPRSIRSIYNAFVQTGEVPRVRNGGFDSSLDVPVQSFGDVDSANVFVSSLSSRLDEIRKVKEAEEIKLKELRRAEIDAAYRDLHKDDFDVSSVEPSAPAAPVVPSEV